MITILLAILLIETIIAIPVVMIGLYLLFTQKESIINEAIEKITKKVNLSIPGIFKKLIKKEVEQNVDETLQQDTES